MRKLVFVLVLLSAVLGFAESSSYCTISGSTCRVSSCARILTPSVCGKTITGSQSCGGSWGATFRVQGNCVTQGSIQPLWMTELNMSSVNGDSVLCLNSGNLWLDGACCDEECLCLRNGGQWVDGSCQTCNDHVEMPDKCMEVWKNGYSEDSEGNPGGGGYWAIETYTCFYDSCAMSLNCTPKSSFPAGSLTCDDFQDTSSTNGNCIAVIGHQCTIQCGNNITKNCDCDGSCNHAKTLASCQCPQLSSSSNNSSSSQNSSSSESENSSSSSASPNSSNDGPNSSNSPVDSIGNGDWEYNYSGVLNEIEWNTRQTATNTNIAAGYLSSIDRWQSTINFNIQNESNKLQSSIESGATQVATAVNGTKGAIDTSNEILSDIRGAVGSLGDSVDFGDISGWLDSANSTIESLQNPETTIVRIDSLKSDTSQFKSKYSSMFLTGVYTRNGCYEFKMTRPAQNSVFGRVFSSDIVVDFGNLAGIFDLCSIFRGLCRIAGAILVLLISIKSYRSAFSSSDG